MRGQWNVGIICILIASAGLLAHSYPSSFAYDRPVHTIVYAFALAACSFVGVVRTYPHLLRQVARDDSYQAVSKEETNDSDEEEDTESYSTTYKPFKPFFLKIFSALALCALILRIELFRRISDATQCTTASLEVFIPVFVTIYDAFRFQMEIRTPREESPDASIYDSAFSEVKSFTRSSRWRYVPCAILFSTGAYLTTSLWSGLQSTYICPIVNGQGRTIPLLQLAAMILDAFLVCVSFELSLPGSQSGLNIRGQGPLTWILLLGATTIFWTIVGVVLFFAKPESRGWLIAVSGPFGLTWLKAATWQALLISVLLVSAAHSVLNLPPVGLTMLLASVFVLVPAFKMLWTARLPFPPTPVRGSIFSFVLIYTAWLLYGRLCHFVGSRSRTGSSGHFFYFLLFLFVLIPGLHKSNQVSFHPIDLLIYEARVQHTQYAEYQTQSHRLEGAVAQYRRRYNLSPPPGFDRWYEYAINRSCLIIDSYDQIHDDLLPWRTVPPADIRQLTWEVVSNPWNEVCGISIRGGVPRVMANTIPTHRWMLEGIVEMMKPFAEFLPDMDVAFNINDESRVATPYSEIQQLRTEGLKKEESAAAVGGIWSDDRNSTWLPLAEEPATTATTTKSKFKNLSFQQTFHAYGSIGCPPDSLARQMTVNSMEHVCHECAAPHSLGQFLSNWSYAADVCHQPDLARLHGCYLSPAAFKASNSLLPVFSQSKPHGYNDILYPSPWNYLNKALYAPSDPISEPGKPDYKPGHPDLPYSEKQNVLFWRGSTSEGVAEGAGRSTWRGMTRQRLAHLANNLTTSSHDSVSVFLPKGKEGKWQYHVVSGKDLQSLGLATDIAVVEPLARCGGSDCDEQGKEFGLVRPSDFQEHWQYRFLFDLDGAGFSGRFLPFLQSRSLPFKAALFREWYDDRITAWRHFVPQDIRLHNVFSTLAYFAGVNGTLNGKQVYITPHDQEGEYIAEQGREWAGKVLRREDMEVYFFRLLLEWGRLTDDRRDEIGYVYRKGDAHGL